MITDALRGTYLACFNAGADVDFIDGNRIDSQSLSAYRVVIHPFPALMSDVASLKLARYVDGGGTLICGPVPGRFDEHGFARLHFMNSTTQELFGVRHASIQQVAEFGGQRKWTPAENRPGDLVPATTLAGLDLLNGLRPKAAFYLETFETQTAKPLLLWDTKVVAARNSFGQGTAYLFGTQFSHSILGEHCKDFQQAIERLLRSTGAVSQTGCLSQNLARATTAVPSQSDRARETMEGHTGLKCVRRGLSFAGVFRHRHLRIHPALRPTLPCHAGRIGSIRRTRPAQTLSS